LFGGFVALVSSALFAEEVFSEGGEVLTPFDVRVIDRIPDGAPRPPSKPQPRIYVQPEDIRTTKVIDLGERVVTIQKIAPIELPAIPETKSVSDPNNPKLREFIEARKHHQTVFIGATTYFSSKTPDKARSLVRYWSAQGAAPIQFWTDANLLHMTGFGEFEAEDTRYSLMMMVSHFDLEWPKLAKAWGSYTIPVPEIPEFIDGVPASFRIIEGKPTEEQLSLIKALMRLYDRDKERMRTAYEQRMAAAKVRALERQENPPEKKNLVLRYWRADAAGRAGTNPKPADIR